MDKVQKPCNSELHFVVFLTSLISVPDHLAVVVYHASH
jgi:hypothetical protein